MPTFKSPVYSKTKNQKGQVETCYSFATSFTEYEEQLTIIADNESGISLDALHKCIDDNNTWWESFVTSFLEASSKLFLRPYTVDHINKIVKHELNGSNSEFPVNVTLVPTSIQIKGGVFIVKWSYTCEPLVIDIPDVDSDSDASNDESNDESNDTSNDVSNDVSNEFKEMNMDDMPIDKNPTEPLEIKNMSMSFEKQKVKEARLKAKLAMYKARHQLEKFYEKYGTEVSDSDSEDE